MRTGARRQHGETSLTRLGGVAGKASGHASGGIAHLEGEFRGHRVAQPIVQQRACRVRVKRCFHTAGASSRTQIGARRQARRKQMRRTRRARCGKFAQRRHVIEHPEAAPLRGERQVVVDHGDVRNGHQRQIALERLPPRTVIHGDEESELGAGVEQAGTHLILTHHTDRIVGRNPVVAIGQARPGGTVVIGTPDVRGPVVKPVAMRRHVRAPRHVRREINPIHGGLRQHPRRGDVFPSGTAVARELHTTIIGAGPERLRVLGIFGQRKDGVVHLHAGDIHVDRPPGGALCDRIVCGEVRTDRFPADAAIARAVHRLRGVVHRVGIVTGHQNGSDPLKTVRDVFRWLPDQLLRIQIHVATFAGAGIPTIDRSAVATAPDDLGVIRMQGNRPGFAAAGIAP